MSSSHTEIEYPPLSQSMTDTGYCTIVGFGSLLSRRSCEATFGPNSMKNFRPGVIHNWRRVFAHVAPIFIERGIARVETKEMSSLSVEPCEGSLLRVCLFEIPIDDLPAFYLREMEFRWLRVPVFGSDGVTPDSLAIGGEGTLCAAYTDREYREIRLAGSEAAYEQAFGRWKIEQIWRDDLLPCRAYLRHVVLAAAGMDHTFKSSRSGKRLEWRLSLSSPDGNIDNAATIDSNSHTNPVSSSLESSPSPPIVTSSYVSLAPGDILDSFLDQTFLGDRRTTIRQYLFKSDIGAEIMCTLPPESLKQRYSG